MSLFVFGLGYTAETFARLHASRFASVTATVTTEEKAARLKGDGIDALCFDSTSARCDERIEDRLVGARALLVSIPPDGNGEPVLARFSEAIARAPGLSWIGYLSTVGVYGDHGGKWVDETSPCNPGNDRSRQRLASEEAWLAFGRRTGKAVAVFRLAGIYGPGRNALKNLADGTARRIVKPGQVFNRIHVDDIAATLFASLEKKRAGAIYNVADGAPAPAQDVVAYAAELAGIAPPPEIPFDKASLSPMAREFYGENKRVANRLIRDELGVALTYPTYREGLRALWSAGEGCSGA